MKEEKEKTAKPKTLAEVKQELADTKQELEQKTGELDEAKVLITKLEKEKKDMNNHYLNQI